MDDDEPEFVIEKITANKPVAESTPRPAAVMRLNPTIGELLPLSDSKDTSAIIGHDMGTDAFVRIGEEERCGGVYILRKPRTGKSTLLISMALSDIRNGYGILFIDPHTDAINELRGRIPERRQKDIILLDPTDSVHSFGINLLACSDRRDPLAIDETWARVRDVFTKVWGDAQGQLGIWLEKILPNCVYLLVENPEYTLVEVPLLIEEDTSFRNYLLSNSAGNHRGVWNKPYDEVKSVVGPVMPGDPTDRINGRRRAERGLGETHHPEQ